MSRITIQKGEVEKRKGLVILPIGEYEKLLRRSAPVYHLTGRSAEKLDKLVIRGMKEYRAGKTRKIHSLADLG